ncbi:type II secretion system protein, partial [Candidatus Curtissbacteria bacterium]|nr:type II secretion system protein [Candidatus Curtissbacteria bacterium]
MSHKLNGGFTLIELLIVVAILGILAAAVFAALNPGKRQRQAKDSQIKSDIGQIATGLQTYFTAPGKGSYPDDLDDIVDSGDLKFLPKPPSGAGTAYNYQPDPVGCDEVNTVCSSAVVSASLL